MTAWLLTWFWQGSVLAAAVATALRWAPRRNAATRHLVWCAALVAVACLGWVSLPYGAPAATLPSGADRIYVPSAPDFLIDILVGFWAAIALVNLVRVLHGLRGIYALRDRCRPFPAHVESQLPLWLEAKGSGRGAALMTCDAVAGATVLGFRSPCIAVPPALVDALRVDELDQVILHEHAHVQRFDDWARLGETLLLSVLWVHPAALFLSRALNREREMACDEWVVGRTASPSAYARCLVHAAEARVQMRGGSTLVPALIGDRHDLLRRIDRVLAINGRAQPRVSVAGVTAAVCAMVLTSVLLQTMRGFSEIVEIVLPQVRSVSVWTEPPMLGTSDGLFLALAGPHPRSLSLGGASSTRFPPAGHPNAAAALGAPAPRSGRRRFAPAPDAAPMAPTAPMASAPTAPLAADLSARVFPGAYTLHETPADASTERSQWRVIATPGLEIASSAKKISTGVAGIFSRAGVSLARSF
jgi:beta-lactamase regulating signal transducer with metallopeptidase domain